MTQADPTPPDPQVQELLKERRTAQNIAIYSLVAAIVLAAVILTRPVPYVQISPGPVFNTIGEIQGKPAIQISGAKTYPTAGELNLLTVQERGGPYGELTLPEAFFGWISPVNDVVPTRVLYPENTTSQEVQQQNTLQFDNSQSAAATAALKSLGYPVREVVVVAQVVPNSPAQAVLKAGDILVSIAGVKIESPQQAVKLIQSKKPGTQVAIRYERAKRMSTANVTLTHSERDSSLGYLGVMPANSYRSPVQVTFGVDGVGGPSAGMMFALGIVDKLTPEQLNGGKIVSGTGTIDSDGTVGAVGGVKQKMSAAEAQGSELFLVAEDDCSDVVDNPPDHMRAVPVATLNQARAVLKRWVAGDRNLPRCEDKKA